MKRFLLIASLFATLLTSINALATCDSREALQANQRWAQALGSNDPATVSKLYSDNAILLATYESIPITTNNERLAYFKKLFSELKNAQVHYNKIFIQQLTGGTVSSGLYTFEGIKDGKATRIPARFTFVYQSTPAGCQLIAHHSSAALNS